VAIVGIGIVAAEIVGRRLGRTILELGGNNAIIVMDDADLDLATRAVLFAAVGTAGQRCTSTRRLILQKGVAREMTDRLVRAYRSVRIGDPLDPSNHVGPLIDKHAVENYLHSIGEIKKHKGKFVVEGGVLSGPGFESGCYVKPCIAEVENHWDIVQHETFAPILYLIKYKTIEEAIALQNAVPQGLSSAIMTTNLREAERRKS